MHTRPSPFAPTPKPPHYGRFNLAKSGLAKSCIALALWTLVLALAGCSPSKEGDNYQTVTEEDPAMNAAIEKAKSTVDDFVKAFHAQKSGAKDYYVKKPYPTPSGSAEHMWIEVTAEAGGVFQGQVANEAEETREVKMGQTVSVKVSEISDWKYQDGKKLVGGFTIRYFVDKMSPQERAAFLQQTGFEL